ncbi:MAG TPA: wax ester/triacylglycerol synthase domain-containing protein [Acidimicrobiales bacterium]|nr:wax ester/triacylglycerol synthase domain-containing protein [Acidimicrobiales bacterium]
MARTECEAERLTAEDARILGLERGAIAGHCCNVIVVDPPPDGEPPTIDALRAHITSRLDFAPRCRQRLAPTPLGLAPPLWVDDIDFDITRHVRQLAEDREIDDETLPRVLARLMEGRLDRRHPLWSLHMARLRGGRTALLWREHHCMADGMSSLRLLSALLWDTEPHSGPAESPPHHPTPSYTKTELLRFGLAARFRPSAPSTDGGAERRGWWPSLAEVGRAAGAVRRELFPSSDLSPLAARVGHRRTVAWISGPLAELHDAGKAVGPRVTVNDVVLAVVTGGMRRWLSAREARAEHIRVKVPVSLHRPGEERNELVNRDSFLFIDLPILEPDIRQQLIAISKETSERKGAHDADELDALIQEAEHLPMGDHVVDLTMSPHVFALNVSNVPGPPGPLSVLGGRVASLDGVAEVAQAHALRVAARSSVGRLSFGLCADPDVVPDLHLIIEGMRSSIEDLLAPAAT